MAGDEELTQDTDTLSDELPGDTELVVADAETRTIRVAHWRHKTVDGGYRISRFGDEVELPAEEVERGDRAGVFEPALPTAVTAAELEAQLASIEPRVAQPAGSEESDAAPLNHDILTAREDLPAEVRVDGEELPEDAQPIAPLLVTEPVDSDPAASIEVTPPPVERPKTAQSVEVWRDYIRKVRPDLAAEVVDEMTKDELKAAAPKGD